MNEYEDKEPLSPFNSPNDATATRAGEGVDPNGCGSTALINNKTFGNGINMPSKLREDAHAEANQKMKESFQKEQTEGGSSLEPPTKNLTPQEMQQKIHTENLRNQLNNNRKVNPPWKPLGAPKLVPEPVEIDPSIVAIVAAIEAGAPFAILLDDGKEVTLHAAKMMQPTILGLLVKFVHQLTTQEIIPKGPNNE